MAGRTERKTVGVPVSGELVGPDVNDPWSELAELLPVVLKDLGHLWTLDSLGTDDEN